MNDAALAGTAYGHKVAPHDARLTEVGPGTPMGELLRRYWHPVGKVEDAGPTPCVVKALGEELILFRDGRGRAGLLHPRCCHRGTTLHYGRVEEDGIRCCYHGWLFDPEGRCLDQPTEPEGGRHKDKVRQPWYPVRERYGLIFAYMGPPDRMPALPRYECLEVLEDGEIVVADDTSIGGGGGAIIPCNWLQHYENVVDPFHVPILHGSFSGMQFTAALAAMPEVDFSATPVGVKVTSTRPMPDGRILHRITEAVLPTLRVVPNPRVGSFGRVESIGWVLPMDDTHFRIYVAARVRSAEELNFRSKFDGKFWWDLTDEEHRRMPGDYEAQVGQGPITSHADEHLVSSDKGIAMLRRLLRRAVATVEEGGDPPGVVRGEDAGMVVFEAGNRVKAD